MASNRFLVSLKSSTPLQPPTRDFYYIFGEVKETQLTREEVLECLPLDLHPFVIVHDFEEDFASYPALGMDDGDEFPTKLWASHAGLSTCCGYNQSLFHSEGLSSQNGLLLRILRCAQGPGPRAAFVAMSRFMQRYRAYDYAWVVEYDVRCALPTWPLLGHLNASHSYRRK